MCRGINISMNKNKNNNHKYKNNKKKTNKVLTKRQKLEKNFRNVKREYLRCSRMLFHCRNDLKNMINSELIRQKKGKIARLEIQVEKLRKKGTELLDQIDEIKQQKS